MKKFKLLFSPIFLILTTCGGGSSSETNVAPQFTSGNALTFVENGSQALQLTATDSSRQTVSFSISGGADAARFTITATGALNFTTAPNFESPTDSDGDNVYQIIITASDGQSTTNQSLNITVVNSREGIGVRRLFTGFTDPVAITAIPGDNRLIIAEKNGSIWYFDTVTNTRTLFIIARAPGSLIGMPRDISGLLDITIARDLRSSLLLYFAFEDLEGNIQLRVNNISPLIAATENTGTGVIFIPRTRSIAGATASLATDRDNSVYFATSDAGNQNNPTSSAQDDNSQLGKLIRVILNPDPFAGASVGPTYLFSTRAKGLRQPSGLKFLGNDILIGDQGQARFGEINRISLVETGLNFGWPFREGDAINLSGGPAGFIDPILQVAFGTGSKQGNAIRLGQVFPSSGADLRSKLIFSDTNGSIWTVPIRRRGQI